MECPWNEFIIGHMGFKAYGRLENRFRHSSTPGFCGESIGRAIPHPPVDVVYAVNGLNAWPAVAKFLYERCDWDPVYWVAPPTLQEAVLDKFPESTVHTHYEANKGIYPNDNLQDQVNALDSFDFENYSKYLNTALRLMDRMEVRDMFHFDERVHHFYRQLAYWTTIVERIDPNVAVFDSSPHVLAHYTLYAVCNENDVTTVFLTPTGLPNTILARTSLHHMPSRIKSYLDEQPSSAKFPDQYYSYIETIRESGYEDAKPTYMETEPIDHVGPRKLLEFWNWPRYVYRSLTDSPITYLKPPNGSVEEELSYPQYIYYQWFAKRRRRSLQKTYDKIAQPPDIDEEYIYIPLHYQPERTSVPEGGVYGDQYLMLDLLSKVIPSEWKLYIKEHPAQFESSKAHQGRWPRSYQLLEKIDCCRLIDFSKDSFQLIDNSRAVATLTGTAGWEAVVRGTPALVFGNAWYRHCPGVYDIDSRQDARLAVDHIRKKPGPSKEDIGSFVAAVHRAGTRGYLSPNSPAANRISTEANVQGIVQAIMDEVSTEC